MSENYAVINGKRIELTDEQVKALGIERKNPFNRVDPDVNDKYYYIRVSGDVADYRDVNDNADKLLYEASNYFNDKDFAEQVALHQLLYRKLLKFGYDNNCEDTAEWNGHVVHWTFYYSHDVSKYTVTGYSIHKFACVWFSSKEGAERAIKEVVMPFVKEHPDFVW